MKRLLPILLLASLSGCSKKNSIPGNATTGNIKIVFPGTPAVTQSDYSAPSSGSLPNSIDGGGWGSTYPIDPAFSLNLSGTNYYKYLFSGYTPRYFSMTIITPAIFGTQQNILSGSFLFGDTAYIVKSGTMNISVTTQNASPTNSSFSLTIFSDTLVIANGRLPTNFQSVPIAVTGTVTNEFFF